MSNDPSNNLGNVSESQGNRMYSLQKYIQYRNNIVYLNYKKQTIFAIQTGSLVRCLCVLKVGRGL